MKLPFSRNKDKDNVPAEIQEYYQAEKRERTGVAWLIAVVTLLVTVAIALGLFFGGRWIYRTLTDNNDQGDQSTSQGEVQAPGATQPDESTADTPETPGNDGDEAEDDNPASPSETEPDESADNQDPTTPGPGGTTPPPASPTPSTPPVSSPTTGDPLPGTGPGQVLGLFAGSSLAGAALHGLYRSRRPRR